MKRTLIGLLLLWATAPANAETTLNLKDADINTLITTVSEVTGKNFIVDDKVRGKVTVISARPMSNAGVYQTFLAVLAVKGFAVVEAGEVYKIVLDNSVKSEGGASLSDGTGRPLDDIVTHVYAIENVSAAQLVPILRPMVPQWGHLAAYAPSNMLIISDRASNVKRLQKIIEQIDRSGDRDIEVVKLQHAGASDVVRILSSLTQQDKKTDPTAKPVTVVADERSNSVLIGGDKSDRQGLLDIISLLDEPLSDDGATQVIYLRYASAENLAPILEGYAAQSEEAGGAARGKKAPAGIISAGGQDTRIIPDADTNALVVTASPKAMRAIRNVIAQLDIKRSQVLVEAIIAEVSASKSNQLGIDWALFNNERIAAAGILDGSVLALAAGATSGTPTGVAGALSSLSSNPPGLIAGGGVSNSNGTSFAVLLKALQSDGDTNILSTPSIVATDNEESELFVGGQVSIPSGSYSSVSGGSAVQNPFTTFNRTDVGLTLNMTPQIGGEGESIKMTLEISISNVAAGSAGAADLQTTERRLATTVTVDSGQILVLGGLIDDQKQDTESGIPILSSIPFLGSLFQSRSISNQKRNLMVFIRPAILRTDDQVDYYTRLKYDSVRQSQRDLENQTKSTVLPTGNPPELPPYRATDSDAPKAQAPEPAADAAAEE